VPQKARAVAEKLAAAGVGARPAVFVAHSMGGLMVKEMLLLALEEEEAEGRGSGGSISGSGSGGANAPSSSNQGSGNMLAATRGVVFFATPHFGSPLATLGLKLRRVPGASHGPAPAVHHLAPGPHLEALNEMLRGLHDEGACVRV
jgi:hypothetical protein